MKLGMRIYLGTLMMSITRKSKNYRANIVISYISTILSLYILQMSSDLAGGLAVQSSGMIFVKQVIGCYHNVMGFPISSFYQELSKFII